MKKVIMDKNDNCSLDFAFFAIQRRIVEFVNECSSYREAWDLSDDEKVEIFTKYSGHSGKWEYHLLNAYFNLKKLLFED